MSFDAVFDAYCDFHMGRGFAVRHFLNPPASVAEIAAAEDAIGFALPEDLKALWRRTDGQPDPSRINNPAPGTVVCPLFGQYNFTSVAKSLLIYKGWRDIYEDAGDQFDENFNDVIVVRGSDPVAHEYWRPGWVPFTIDGGGNSYAVDLSPPEGGTYGQVIVIGPDEDLRRVLAPSLTALIEAVIAQAPTLDQSMLADKTCPLVYFDSEEATPTPRR